MTILNTLPSLPAFPDSSFALVAFRNRVRERIDQQGLSAAELQCLDDHCRDINIGKEGGGEERRSWKEEVSESAHSGY